MNAMLRVEGLSKSFTVHQLGKHIRACEGVSLEVGSGEFVGITGRSGSGKSTVLKLIYRSYVPQAGSAWYDSAAYGPIDLFRATERQVLSLRRSEIGYVSQFLDLLPRTTARETVERAAQEVGRSSKEARLEAELMLEHFELAEELRDSYASTFSGGEKLRLNIARAMVKHPRLLLLDEPTASLDAHSKGRVRQLIERLKSEGTTMLGIFHDLEFMEGLCDREYKMGPLPNEDLADFSLIAHSNKAIT
jgi:alpha-D-ribose 1-methylphosphonate 5-triphosphate synthase subunit PhnL